MTIAPIEAAPRPQRAASPADFPRVLRVSSPAMRGVDVLLLQELLAGDGYGPGRRDGVFGDATDAAVRAFQGQHGLEVDGIVGHDTVRALTGAQPIHGPVALRRHGSKLGREALAEAQRWLGYREDPPGSNRTRFGQWFGVDGVAWCNIFVSYCFAVGAGYTICSGYKGPGVHPKGCAYVPTTEAWLRATGLWVGRTTALPGDIAIFNWDRAGVPEHIGLVERNLGDGRIQTIEGNTSVGNDSNGGQVMRRLRYLTQIDGFGRVRRHGA